MVQLVARSFHNLRVTSSNPARFSAAVYDLCLRSSVCVKRTFAGTQKVHTHFDLFAHMSDHRLSIPFGDPLMITVEQ